MSNIFYHSVIAKGLLYFSNCHTIMLFGFVFSKLKEDDVTSSTINHESVHARQWCETTFVSALVILALILIFGISPLWWLFSGVIYYAWYIVEWMCKGVYYSIMNDEWDCPSQKKNPYKELSFEREARLAEKDDDYLECSGYFGWLKML